MDIFEEYWSPNAVSRATLWKYIKVIPWNHLLYLNNKKSRKMIESKVEKDNAQLQLTSPEETQNIYIWILCRNPRASLISNRILKIYFLIVFIILVVKNIPEWIKIDRMSGLYHCSKFSYQLIQIVQRLIYQIFSIYSDGANNVHFLILSYIGKCCVVMSFS